MERKHEETAVVRPFGRLVATEISAPGITPDKKGQFLSHTSGSAWNDAPDPTDLGPF